MEPTRIFGSNNLLTVPRDWREGYGGPLISLPIKFDRDDTGAPSMASTWLPTSEDMVKLVEGAPIVLKVFGYEHPPVLLEVGDRIRDLPIANVKASLRAARDRAAALLATLDRALEDIEAKRAGVGA